MASRREFFRAMVGRGSAGRGGPPVDAAPPGEMAHGSPPPISGAWPETLAALEALAEALPTGPSGDADADFAAAAGPLLAALVEVCSARAEAADGAACPVAARVLEASLAGLQEVIDLDAARAGPIA